MGDPSIIRFIPAESAACAIDWSKMPEASKKFFLEGWCRSWKTGEINKDLPATLGDLVHMINDSKFFGYLETQRCTLLLDINKYGLAALRNQRATGPHRLPVGPRFYMQYLDKVWFVLFVPGERGGVIGYSGAVVSNAEDEDENRKNQAEEDVEKDAKEESNDGDGEEFNVAKEESNDAKEESNDAKEESNDGDEEEFIDEDEDEDYDDVDVPEEETPMTRAATRMAREYDTKLADEVGRLSTLGVINGKIAGWEAYTIRNCLEQAKLCDDMLSLPGGHPALGVYMQNFF